MNYRVRILNTLERMKLRVKHGVMREDNKVYEILRRNPPPVKPVERELKEIVFPWEELEEKRIHRLFEEDKMPYAPSERPDLDPAVEFARRQYKRMTRQGETEEEAYMKVEAQYAAERSQAIAQIRKIRTASRQWHRGQAEAPFFDIAKGDTERASDKLGGWTELSLRLDKKPWPLWTIPEKVDLDSWIVSSVLGWRWQIERVFDEEAAVLDTWKEKATVERVALALEFANLRRDLFWPKLSDPHAGRHDLDVDDSLDKGIFDAEIDDSESDEPALDATFDIIQARVEEKPLSEWTQDEVDEMDTYLKENIVDPRSDKEGIVVIDPSSSVIISPDLPIERLRLEVFPELCPTYQRMSGSMILNESSSLDETQQSIPAQFTPDDASLSEKKKHMEDKQHTEQDINPTESLFDATTHSTYDPDGKRVLRVNSISDPKQMAQALFKAGIFPDVNIDDVLKRDAEAATDEDRILPTHIANALRQARAPNSHEMKRLKAGRTAIQNDVFFNRIYRKLENEDPYFQSELKNQKLLDDDEAEQQQRNRKKN